MGQKVVIVDTHIITDLIRQGAERHERVIEGLPGDAKLLRIVPEHMTGWEVHAEPRLGFVYESSEWPELPEGSMLPEQRITLEAIRGK